MRRPGRKLPCLNGDAMLPEVAKIMLAPDVSFQSLGPGQETVLLSFKSGYLYTCNETTEAFLRKVDGRKTLGEVVDMILQEYDVPREVLLRDMAALAEKLAAEKLLTISAEV